MSVANLVHQLKFRKIEELYPLVKVPNEAEMKRLQENGINIDLSADVFEEKFEGIPVEKVYFLKDSTSKYFYVDLDTYNVMDLNIYNGQFLGLDEETLLEVWQKIVELKKECLESRDFIRLLGITPSCLNSALLNHILECEEPSEEMYELFLDIYCHNDYAAGLLSKQAWNNIMQSFDKASNHKEGLELKLADLPEKITVYRGEGDKSTPHNEALSWTLSPNVALFFALRFATKGQETAHFITGTVNKEDVLAYIQDREEEELIVKPGTVQVTSKIDCLSLDDVVPIMDDANFSYFPFQEALRDLLRQGGNEKTILHKLRIGRYATILAELEGLEFEEVGLLLGAILKLDGNRIKDKDKVNVWLNQALNQSNELPVNPIQEVKHLEYTTMISVLKDAIELDKLRFGFEKIDLLNLRLRTSWELLYFAQLCIGFLKLD